MTDILPSGLADAAPSNLDRSSLADFGKLVRRLSLSLRELEQAADPLQLPPLAGREWFDLLQRKLLPQLVDDAYLIVAVVGGTNIGKSVVFNHIAGFRASASSPLASGTKHPVCLIPTGFADNHDLGAVFPSFQLRPWSSSDEPLQDVPDHCLFWRSHEQVPDNLVVLDTPDVDSDAPVNWQRADAVRQSADVLVAVLTQQKYNDAAVKQFFRKAAAEDKAAIIVFNQVQLPDDEEYWPIWLGTFCGETGLNPEFVYVAPNNRKAAEAIALEFEERRWPQALETSSTGTSDQISAGDHFESRVDSSVPTIRPERRASLSEVFSRLRFAEIKLRTLRRSLLLVADPDAGARAYLNEIQAKSRQFRDAAGIFLRRSMVQHADWPAPPGALIVEEMWVWWREHREAWTAGIHGFYARIGGFVRTGIQVVRKRLGHIPTDPVAEYRVQEWSAIVRVLEQLYEQLKIITTLDNPLLKDRLNRLLAGTSREAVLGRLQEEHVRFDFTDLVKQLVTAEMEWLRTERQPLFEVLRKVDGVTAVVRPVITIGFALGGGVGAEHFIIHAATQTLAHVAVDATAAAASTVAGEAAVDAATGILGQAKASLLRLQEKFVYQREVWLLDQLRRHLLGELLNELQAGASAADSAAFADVAATMDELGKRLQVRSPS